MWTQFSLFFFSLYFWWPTEHLVFSEFSHNESAADQPVTVLIQFSFLSHIEGWPFFGTSKKRTFWKEVSVFQGNIRMKDILLCYYDWIIFSIKNVCLSLDKLNWDSQKGRDLATSGGNNKISIRPILFLYYEESLVWSNLNSKQLRFHDVRPNLHTPIIYLNVA